MGRRQALAGVVMLVLAFAVSSTASAASAKWTPKKTPWGDPDLQGTWPLDQLGRTPLQRPVQYGDRLNLTDE